MSNCLKSLVLLFISIFVTKQLHAQNFVLSENSLKELAAQGAPQLEQIQAAFYASDLQKAQVNEIFSPELFGKASYAEANEKPIIQFIPIWSPVKQAQLGVRQNFKQGLSAEAAITTDQRSASSVTGKYNDITTTSLSFMMQMDLWKDLFGQMSKAQIDAAQYESQRAEIEKNIQIKTFLISLRRIFWGLVANKESMKISEELLRTSRQQLEESKRRFKNSVAEIDEVARNEAQVSSREANIIYLNYQKEALLKQLKTLLPDLSSKEISLADYNLPQTIDHVAACTGQIAQESKIPYQNTNYDEVMELLKKMKGLAASVNSKYDDADLKLYGLVRTTGVGSEGAGTNAFRGSYGSSVGDAQFNNRTGYELGLKINVPLGDSKSQTQKTKELYDEKRFLASIQATDAQVINTHQQVIKNIMLLNDVIRSQKATTLQLEKRLTHMRRKYEQARVSINDLIMDQDALLRSELTTIETQLQVLNVLFDYLAIYTETPCDFNRI